MRKKTFYLDTNVISRLANPEQTVDDVRCRLKRLVLSRVIEKIGDTAIIEEFAGMGRANPEQFARSLKLFWTLVGDKVLDDTKILLEKERRKGSMLSRKEAILDAGKVHQLRMWPLDDRDGWEEIANGVRGMLSPKAVRLLRRPPLQSLAPSRPSR